MQISRLLSCLAVLHGALLITASPVRAQSLKVRDESGRERTCEWAMKPKDLPSAASLLDTAAAAAVLQRLAAADSGGRVLSILLAESGAVASVRQVEAPSGDQALVHGLEGAIIRQRPQATVWAVRLRVHASRGVSLAVERSVFCPATPAGASGGARTGMVQIQPGDQLPAPGQRIQTEAEVAISTEGVATQVKIRRGSGIRELDDELVRDLQAKRYLPATLDGVPLPIWWRTNGTRMRL